MRKRTKARLLQHVLDQARAEFRKHEPSSDKEATNAVYEYWRSVTNGLWFLQNQLELPSGAAPERGSVRNQLAFYAEARNLLMAAYGQRQYIRANRGQAFITGLQVGVAAEFGDQRMADLQHTISFLEDRLQTDTTEIRLGLSMLRAFTGVY